MRRFGTKNLSEVKGPLTGQMVKNKGNITAKWGDIIKWDFTLTNQGDEPLTINSMFPIEDDYMRWGTKSDSKTVTGIDLPLTLEPKKPTNITIQTKLNGKPNSNPHAEWEPAHKPNENGVVNYDASVKIITDSKHPNYMIYCRATITIQDINDFGPNSKGWLDKNTYSG